MRREQARIRHALRNNETEVSTSLVETSKTEESNSTTDEPACNENDIMFIAFGRVYSGTLKVGQEIYVLGPKHDPSKVKDKVLEKECISLTLIECFQIIIYYT